MTSLALLIGFIVGLAWRRAFVAPMLRGHHSPRLLRTNKLRFRKRPLCEEGYPDCRVDYYHDHFPG